MLADYEVTEMGCFDDYLDAVTRDKIMMVNVITTSLVHIAQCITFMFTYPRKRIYNGYNE